MRSIILVLILVLFGSIPIATAQDYIVKRKLIGIQDGLENRKVQSVCLDDESNIWVANVAGVSIFTGTEQNNEVNVPEEISAVFFTNIVKSADGYLWFYRFFSRSYNREPGVEDHFIYHPKEERFLDLSSLLDGETLYGIIQEKNGKIWLWTEQGSLFSYETRLIRHSTIDTPFDLLRVHSAGDGKLILVYKNKIATIDSNENVNTQPLNFFPANSRISKSGELILAHRWINKNKEKSIHKVGIWDGTPDVKLFEGLTSEPGPNQYRTFIFEMEQYILLFYKGEYVIVDSKAYQVIESGNLFPSGVYSNVNDVFQYTDNEFWVSTSTGLLVIDVFQSQVQNYLVEESSSTRAILPWKDDKLFVASTDGFIEIDPLTGAHKMISNVAPYIYNLIKLEDGKLLGGLPSKSVAIFDTTDWSDRSKSLSQIKQIQYLYTDPVYVNENDLWIKTSFGAYRYDYSRDTFHAPSSIQNSAIASSYINSIDYIDSNYYFGTRGGMYVTDLKEAPKIVGNTEKYNITDIHKDGEILWLSTMGNGLLKYDNTTKASTWYNSSTAGFSNDFIYSIHRDDFGYFWLPTNYGLIRMNIDDSSIQVFLPEDGFANYEYNFSSFYEDDEGTYYFGGLDGITKVVPKDFIEQGLNPEIRIVTAEYLDNSGRIDEFENKEEKIVLPNSYQLASFVFNTNDLLGLSDTKFAYKIDGYNPSWTEMTGNTLELYRIPFGSYELNVRATATGQYHSQEIIIPFLIQKPYYLTFQFGFFVLIGLAILAYLISAWRTRTLTKRNKLLELLVEERTKALSLSNEQLKMINDTRDRMFGIIAHDLRGPLIGFKNLGSKINFLKRKNRLDEIEMVSSAIDENYNSLMSLLDNLLRWISIQKGRLPIENTKVDLEKHVAETIELYATAILEKELKVKADIQTKYIFADPDAINIVLRNLLNNAVKYCQIGGQINIQSRKVGDQVAISIADNGIGMDKETIDKIFTIKAKRGKEGTKGERSTGIGLPLTYELIDLMEGSIEVESELNKGTIVRFFLS